MGLGIDGSNTEPSDPKSRDHKPIHLIKRAPTGAQIGESKMQTIKINGKEMKEYIVTWRIEIYAEDKNHAALQAREIQLDPNSIATIFEVAEDIEINKESACRE